jgi:hypothetical protein
VPVSSERRLTREGRKRVPIQLKASQIRGFDCSPHTETLDAMFKARVNPDNREKSEKNRSE